MTPHSGRQTHRSVDLHAVDLRRAACARLNGSFLPGLVARFGRPVAGALLAFATLEVAVAVALLRCCAVAAAQVGTVWSLWSNGGAVGDLSDWHRVGAVHVVGADGYRPIRHHATQLLCARGLLMHAMVLSMRWFGPRWCGRSARRSGGLSKTSRSAAFSC